MNKKRLIIAIIAAAIFVTAFEMLWHGFLMKGMYYDTMSVWRPEEDHDFRVMLLSQFLFAGAVTVFWVQIGRLFTKCKRGIGFGFMLGLVMAAPQLATFCYLPIPVSISVMWMLADFLKALGTSMVAAAIYKD